jgi:hypothetical protein
MDGIIASFLKRHLSDKDTGADTLATLIMAASEDAAFRKRLVTVLRLPTAQREPLIRTAVDEMRLRGEPAGVQEAFLTLTTAHGAKVALHLLGDDPK